jgi:hypothetical protein
MLFLKFKIVRKTGNRINKIQYSIICQHIFVMQIFEDDT